MLFRSKRSFHLLRLLRLRAALLVRDANLQVKLVAHQDQVIDCLICARRFLVVFLDVAAIILNGLDYVSAHSDQLLVFDDVWHIDIPLLVC